MSAPTNPRDERVHVSRAQLESLIAAGDIDTVVMAFPDLQGRLVGKRTTGRFFLEQVAEHGTENCDYLIATDFDDVAVPGYRFASYENGYGDMLARARAAGQEALLLQVAYSSLQAYQAQRAS